MVSYGTRADALIHYFYLIGMPLPLMEVHYMSLRSDMCLDTFHAEVQGMGTVSTETLAMFCEFIAIRLNRAVSDFHMKSGGFSCNIFDSFPLNTEIIVQYFSCTAA